MIHGKRVVVVLPAYNARQTLELTQAAIPRDVVDEVLVVDDASQDGTAEVARSLGLPTLVHRRNLGYGGNQKTCYTESLSRGADIVVMVHPDYQYDPRLIPAMASLIGMGVYDVVLGSRILGNTAIKGGMPRYKYLANRCLTLAQNLLLRQKLSEYHTGYRAFSRQVLERLPLEMNSNDFVFDNEMLAQCFYYGFQVGEISCPTHYATDSSSISFRRACKYGFGVLRVSLSYRLARLGLLVSGIFRESGGRLNRESLKAKLVEGSGTVVGGPGSSKRYDP